MNGVNNQSAEAFAGASVDTMSASAPVMNNLRNDIINPCLSFAAGSKRAEP
jgi:hypothetical protein